MQTITGHNFARARCIAVIEATHRGECGLGVLPLQIVMSVFAAEQGGLRLDAAVIAEVARILPIMSAGFFLSGGVLAMHFQAIGDAPRAGLLGLSKPYLFAIPLTFVLAAQLGEIGIWLAAPLAEILLLALTAGVLMKLAKARSLRWGVFQTSKEELA